MWRRHSLERLERRCSLKMFSCLMPLFPVMIFPTTSSSSISTWVSASSSSVSSSCSNSSTLSLCLLSCSSWAVSTLFYRSAISSYLTFHHWFSDPDYWDRMEWRHHIRGPGSVWCQQQIHCHRSEHDHDHDVRTAAPPLSSETKSQSLWSQSLISTFELGQMHSIDNI